MNLNGKVVSLAQLEDELASAGVAILGLGTAGDDLHTYDQHGLPVDLPPGAAAVIAAHEPAPVENPYSILRSLLEFTEGPEDLKLILDAQFELLGG